MRKCAFMTAKSQQIKTPENRLQIKSQIIFSLVHFINHALLKDCE
jgi:hypothetical protein